MFDRQPSYSADSRFGSSSVVGGLVVALLFAMAPRAGAQIATGEVVYTGEAMSVVSGGIRTGTAYLGNVDLLAELAYPTRGLTFFAYALANHGDSPSDFTGDAQVVSNIDAPEAVRVFEAWVEKDFFRPRVSLLAGLYDLNSEFDVVETGDVFLNSSFGIGAEYSQSGHTGPSIFPVTSLALRGTWRPHQQGYLQAAVLDAVPGDAADETATTIRLSSTEGALLALEAGWHFSVAGDGSPTRERDGGASGSPPAQPTETFGTVGRAYAPPRGRAKIALGLWYYTRPFPGTRDRTEEWRTRPGVYALAEGPVRGESDEPGSLSLFARAGWADPRIHRFSAYTGTGAVYAGPIPGREADRIGLGVAVAWNGGPYRDAAVLEGIPVSATETAVELTYRVEGDGWAVQPDLQWVVNPDTRQDRENALVLGIRLEAGAGFGD